MTSFLASSSMCTRWFSMLQMFAAAPRKVQGDFHVNVNCLCFVSHIRVLHFYVLQGHFHSNYYLLKWFTSIRNTCFESVEAGEIEGCSSSLQYASRRNFCKPWHVLDLASWHYFLMASSLPQPGHADEPCFHCPARFYTFHLEEGRWCVKAALRVVPGGARVPEKESTPFQNRLRPSK